MTEYIYGTDEQGGHWLTNTEIVRCKDCVHFTPDEEFYIDLGGLVVPGATSDTCDLWAGTKCKTLPDGFCYLGKRKVVD